jgi:DNA-directed RNA polymerase III subunit RPC11
MYSPLPPLRLIPSADSPPVCPTCSNVLTVSTAISADDPTPTNRLECQTCPYEYLLTKRFYERKTFVRKEREDVFGGPGAWDNAQKAQMQCPKEGCDGEEAAFFQVQIRSADEPMTGFYKVRWDEGP